MLKKIVKFIRRGGRVIPINAAKMASSAESHRLVREGAEHAVKDHGAHHFTAIKNLARKSSKEKRIMKLKGKNDSALKRISHAKKAVGGSAVAAGALTYLHKNRKKK